MNIVAVIPARYESTRFPGKPLAKIKGKPMIVHVWERAAEVELLDDIIVATDNKEIYQTVINNQGKAKMTSDQHRSGTDRIAEVARNLDCDLIINIQGDEPLIKKEMIEKAVEPFYEYNRIKMATLKKKIEKKEEIENPNVVKVVTDKQNNALYFSRAPLPFMNNKNREDLNIYKHIGLYVYSRDFLLEYTEMEPTLLEKTESLEQLRVLENGYQIKVIETSYETIGVDRPEDIKAVEKILERGG